MPTLSMAKAGIGTCTPAVVLSMSMGTNGQFLRASSGQFLHQNSGLAVSYLSAFETPMNSPKIWSR